MIHVPISKTYLIKDITYAKSCNSILYTQPNSATYVGSIFGIMCCL